MKKVVIPEHIVEEYDTIKAQAVQKSASSHRRIWVCPKNHINVCDAVIGYHKKYGYVTDGQRKSFGEHKMDLTEYVYSFYDKSVRHYCPGVNRH